MATIARVFFLGGMPRPREFVRSDGTRLEIVPGFRERVLAMPRTPVRPTSAWSDQDYRAAADEKIRRMRRLIEGASVRGVEFAGVRALELGCGPGIDTILLSVMAPGVAVVGVDVALPLFEDGEEPARMRRLAAAVLEALGLDATVEKVFADLPVHLERMSVTDLAFTDGDFEFCWSAKALEHVKPLGDCFDEMWRVLRPGAVAFHAVDPYYWLKGCHRRGVVDLPWAHARLEPTEVTEVARLIHGQRQAAWCEARLAELNRLTLGAWQDTVAATRFDVLEWRVHRSGFAERTLAEFPAVEETLLDGVIKADLIHGAVSFWLRRP